MISTVIFVIYSWRGGTVIPRADYKYNLLFVCLGPSYASLAINWTLFNDALKSINIIYFHSKLFQFALSEHSTVPLISVFRYSENLRAQSPCSQSIWSFEVKQTCKFWTRANRVLISFRDEIFFTVPTMDMFAYNFPVSADWEHGLRTRKSLLRKIFVNLYCKYPVPDTEMKYKIAWDVNFKESVTR